MYKPCRSHLLENMSALKAAEDVRKGRVFRIPPGENSYADPKTPLGCCLVVMLTGFGFAQGAATGDLHITVKDPKRQPGDQCEGDLAGSDQGTGARDHENTEGEYQVLLLPPGHTR